jgi:hypothetical protein
MGDYEWPLNHRVRFKWDIFGDKDTIATHTYTSSTSQQVLISTEFNPRFLSLQ